MCTGSLGGGRRLARKRASSDPTIQKRASERSIAISSKLTSGPNASESSVGQDLCSDVRDYTLRFANQKLAPRLSTGDLYLIHTPFAFQPGDEQDPGD